MQGTNRKTPGESRRFFSPPGLRFPVCFVRPATPRPRSTSAFANAYTFTLHNFFLPLYYTRPPLNCQSAFCISFSSPAPPLLWIMCVVGAEDLGALPRTLLENFPQEVFKTFKNFNPIGFWVLFLHCTDFRCSRIPCCEFRLLRTKSRPAGFGRLRFLRYRIEVVQVSY